MITPLRQQMHQDLQLAGLGEGTQKAYLRAVRQLADHFHKAPDRSPSKSPRVPPLSQERKQLPPSSLIVAASGIKFFYTHTVPRDWKTLKKLSVPRPKTLPDVLTIDEVRRLIDAVRTPHNRTYFWTVYSLGLRLQEGLNLQVGDIDSAAWSCTCITAREPRTATCPCRRAPCRCSVNTGRPIATLSGSFPPRDAITNTPPRPQGPWSVPVSMAR